MKQMGVGLAAAILIDATIVRAVLLPATMKLLGSRNWYLRRASAGCPSSSTSRRWPPPRPNPTYHRRHRPRGSPRGRWRCADELRLGREARGRRIAHPWRLLVAMRPKSATDPKRGEFASDIAVNSPGTAGEAGSLASLPSRG